MFAGAEDSGLKRADQPFYSELSALYRRLLDRDIDNTGYYHYAVLLEEGRRSLDEIERIIVDSEEYRGRVAGYREPGPSSAGPDRCGCKDKPEESIDA